MSVPWSSRDWWIKFPKSWFDWSTESTVIQVFIMAHMFLECESVVNHRNCLRKCLIFFILLSFLCCHWRKHVPPKKEHAASWILGSHLFFHSKGLVNGRMCSITGRVSHEAFIDATRYQMLLKNKNWEIPIFKLKHDNTWKLRKPYL